MLILRSWIRNEMTRLYLLRDTFGLTGRPGKHLFKDEVYSLTEDDDAQTSETWIQVNITLKKVLV